MFTTFKNIVFLFCFSILLFSCKEDTYVVSKVTTKTLPVDATITSANSITKTIAPYKEKMIKEINTVLSYAPKDLTRTDGKLESSLGNLLADLTFKRANPIFKKQTGKNIDFSMFNFGGIRAGIPAGSVRNKNAFELMPFENILVVVELSGQKIAALIAYLIKSNTAHPISKNMELTITKNGYQLYINNKKFDSNKSYFVLTSDYLQSGGDNMTFFKNPIQRVSLEYKMRDAIVDYFKSVDTLRSRLDQRFKRN
ncbi:MAG: 5'-nucleotidase C-terminal domain-containing protein [Flavobacteriaceae bacterium]|nr:5'-nucleotidase C-terminal domain-containing protein [Flavobacteriaceae bacterium]